MSEMPKWIVPAAVIGIVGGGLLSYAESQRMMESDADIRRVAHRPRRAPSPKKSVHKTRIRELVEPSEPLLRGGPMRESMPPKSLPNADPRLIPALRGMGFGPSAAMIAAKKLSAVQRVAPIQEQIKAALAHLS